MRLLGVDPGSQYVGVAILEIPGDGPYTRSKLLDYRYIQGKGGTKYGRFVSLDRQVTDYCREWKPDEAAFEKGFTGHGKQNLQVSAMVVAEARGAVMLSVSRLGIPISEYHQSSIKKAMTGKGNTKKVDVEFFVRATFNLEAAGILQEDTADAIAAAYCHSMQRETDP